MTEEQIAQFNNMFDALRLIAYEFETLTELHEHDYGLEFEEVIEMAYENMQSTAEHALNGITRIPTDN